LDSLTSLRYLAAAAVVITHVNPYFIGSPWLKANMAYWYVGVSFFYLLSGFVLTWSCARQPPGRFWWNRFARIWPMQAVMMIAAYVLLWDLVRHPPTMLGWLLQPFLLQAWDPDPAVFAAGNGPTWSLSCEAFFYLMFPLLLRVVRRLRGRDIAVVACAVVAIAAIAPALAQPHLSALGFDWAFFYLPGYRIGEFIIGMLLARAVALGYHFPRPSVGYLIGWLGLIGWSAVAARYYVGNGHELARPYATLLALPFFSLLVLSAASADLVGSARLLRARFAVRLGEWSFALYLVHSVLFAEVERHAWLHNQGGTTGFGFLLVFMAAATLIAAGAHYVIEKPAERWLRARRGWSLSAGRGHGARSHGRHRRTVGPSLAEATSPTASTSQSA
jgi:peptidoglycan/LPS O-acetylase OafA/YrhL